MRKVNMKFNLTHSCKIFFFDFLSDLLYRAKMVQRVKEERMENKEKL